MPQHKIKIGDTRLNEKFDHVLQNGSPAERHQPGRPAVGEQLKAGAIAHSNDHGPHIGFPVLFAAM
jgi:hypothetical protein